VPKQASFASLDLVALLTGEGRNCLKFHMHVVVQMGSAAKDLPRDDPA
jgi:hypothetical protein